MPKQNLQFILFFITTFTLMGYTCRTDTFSQEAKPTTDTNGQINGIWLLDVDWGKGDEPSKNILSIETGKASTIREAGSDKASKLRELSVQGGQISFEYFFDGNREYNLVFRGELKNGKLRGTFTLLGYDAPVTARRITPAKVKELEENFSKGNEWADKEKGDKDWSDKEKNWDKEEWADKKDWDEEKWGDKEKGDDSPSKRSRRKTVYDIYQSRSFKGANSETIPYRLFVPDDYDPKQKYPLVLFHHGGGGTGDDNRGNLEGACVREWYLPDSQREYPCFLVAPQIPGKTKKDKDEPGAAIATMKQRIQTIHAILDSLEQEFSIDPDRQYVTGLSFGGECTWLSMMERPERFAAAVPICAGDRLMGISTEERGKQFAQFPLWIFHGDADNVISVDVSRKIVAALRQAGGDPKYTEYPGVNHYSWDKAYRDPALKAWLFRQTRNNKQE